MRCASSSPSHRSCVHAAAGVSLSDDVSQESVSMLPSQPATSQPKSWSHAAPLSTALLASHSFGPPAPIPMYTPSPASSLQGYGGPQYPAVSDPLPRDAEPTALVHEPIPTPSTAVDQPGVTTPLLCKNRGNTYNPRNRKRLNKHGMERRWAVKHGMACTGLSLGHFWP